jgi:hypothetical protein
MPIRTTEVEYIKNRCNFMFQVVGTQKLQQMWLAQILLDQMLFKQKLSEQKVLEQGNYSY